jgi:hypothetical protein
MDQQMTDWELDFMSRWMLEAKLTPEEKARAAVLVCYQFFFPIHFHSLLSLFLSLSISFFSFSLSFSFFCSFLFFHL